MVLPEVAFDVGGVGFPGIGDLEQSQIYTAPSSDPQMTKFPLGENDAFISTDAESGAVACLQAAQIAHAEAVKAQAEADAQVRARLPQNDLASLHAHAGIEASLTHCPDTKAF